MTSQTTTADAIVIGGGFYGCTIAVYLARMRGLKQVILLEQESRLLSRASYNNQARVHNGYHYPRSFTTAFRSRVNLPKFLNDWPQSVKKDFIKIYAIARRNSKITARQFERFCFGIGAKLQPAEQGLKKIFEPRLIEDVFQVEEYAFDSTRLAEWATQELQESGITVLLSSMATTVSRAEEGYLTVSIQQRNGENTSFNCRYIFNCTYSGLNQLDGSFPGTKNELKQEITEMALLKVPSTLKDIGITIMDGPFFSIMPFPCRGLHTLSHVRYTPHFSWKDERGLDPYKQLQEYEKSTRADRMIRDASRYLPSVLQSKHVDSLFEIKTVLIKNEGDDGRPILMERHAELPGCYSILGGKIDNIYDVLEKLDEETINAQPNH